MNPTRWIVPAAVLAGALALAACSGGGGTPAAMPQQADMGGEPSSQPPTGGSQDGQPVSLETRARLQIADPERTARGIGAAAGAQPRFGSVTQSSNAAAGVTTDRARAAFANGRLTVTVARQGAAELTLDSADAAAIPGGEASTIWQFCGSCFPARSEPSRSGQLERSPGAPGPSLTSPPYPRVTTRTTGWPKATGCI